MKNIFLNNMNIANYKIHLESELSKLEKPWLNGDEGYIYVGLIKPNKNDYSEENYYFFCYLLCFFVAFDLLVYAYYRLSYSYIKQKLQTPKFEYGLTHTFYYPNVICNRMTNIIKEDFFEKAFLTFIEYLDCQNLELDYKVVLKACVIDKDFQKGLFNKYFLKYINQFCSN